MDLRSRVWRYAHGGMPNADLFISGLRKGSVDLFRAPKQKPLSCAALSVLERGWHVLETAGLRPLISEGTLLGGYRQGSFIPHDTDIDVCVVGPIPTFRLLRAMKKADFFPVRLLWNGRRIQQIASCFGKTGDIFDIAVWWPEGPDEMVLRFPELHYDMKMPSWQFRSTTEVKVSGSLFRTHADPELWLEAQYGPEWRVPESAKPDWRKANPFRTEA